MQDMLFMIKYKDGVDYKKLFNLLKSYSEGVEEAFNRAGRASDMYERLSEPSSRSPKERQCMPE